MNGYNTPTEKNERILRKQPEIQQINCNELRQGK